MLLYRTNHVLLFPLELVLHKDHKQLFCILITERYCHYSVLILLFPFDNEFLIPIDRIRESLFRIDHESLFLIDHASLFPIDHASLFPADHELSD